MNPEFGENARLVENSRQNTPGSVLDSGSAPRPQANQLMSRRPPSNRVRRTPVGYLSELEKEAIQRRAERVHGFLNDQTQGRTAKPPKRRVAMAPARGRKKRMTETTRKRSELVPLSEQVIPETGQTMKEALETLARIKSEPQPALDYSQLPELARIMAEYRQEHGMRYGTMANEKTSTAIGDLDHVESEARSELNSASGKVRDPDASSIQDGTRRTRTLDSQEPDDASLLPENQAVLRLEDLPEHIRERYPLLTETTTNPTAMAAFLAERREHFALFPNRKPNDSLAESLANMPAIAPKLPAKARRSRIRKTRSPTRVPRHRTAPKECMLPGCDCVSAFNPEAAHAARFRRSPEAFQWSAEAPMRATYESAFPGNHEIENTGEAETSAFGSAAVHNEGNDVELV